MKQTTKTSLAIMLLSASVNGFQVIPHQSGRTRQRTDMPPLYYKDIEPEISAITIDPVVNFNDTMIFVQPSQQQSPIKKITTTTRKRRSKTATATGTLPQQQLDQGLVETTITKPPKSHRTTWQTRYAELKHYQSIEGHVLVPQNFPANRKLGLWVMQQRRQYSLLHQEGKRSSFKSAEGKKRMQLLEEIGFVWRMERRGPSNAYGSLSRMKRNADAENGTKGGEHDDYLDAVDFEKVMIKKREVYSDEEMMEAWRRRFEIFQ